MYETNLCSSLHVTRDIFHFFVQYMIAHVSIQWFSLSLAVSSAGGSSHQDFQET